MKVVLTGATGFIGQALCQELVGQGHEVHALVRNAENARSRAPILASARVHLFQWDGQSPTVPEKALNEVEAIIHLAGEPIASKGFPKRWTDSRKKLILDSRTESTRHLIHAISGQPVRPRTFICASAVGYYGDRGDEVLAEQSLPGEGPGAGFLCEVSRQWEKATEGLDPLGIRRLNFRIGMVLGEGGALGALLPIFKVGLGGPVGSGRQWMSWIHIQDLISAVIFALQNDHLRGPLNAVSPHPVTNREFSHELGRILHRPALMKAPAFALKGILGEMASMLLSGQRVIPEKLTDAGFKFRWQELGPALTDVVGTPVA